MDIVRVLERLAGTGGVVAYHGVGEAPTWPTMHVDPSSLREQLWFLRHHYSVLPLSELLDRWRRRLPTTGCVAITFDDAYVGVARHAAELLAAYDLPATVFVVVANARIGAPYWWDTAERDRRAARGGGWIDAPRIVGLQALDASSPHAMEAVRMQVLARFAGRWPAPQPASDDADDWRSMRFDELEQLARDSRFDFGVHTVTHAALPLLPAAEQVAEISEAYGVLRERLPRCRAVLAYPYGLYDERTIAAVRAAGMEAALSIEGRSAGTRPHPYMIPRVGVGAVHNSRSIAMRLCNAARPLLILRNRGVHPRIPAASMGLQGMPDASPAGAERRGRS